MAPSSYNSSLPPVPDSSFDATVTTTPGSNAACPFCRIARQYEPYDPLNPPAQSSSNLSPALTEPDPATYVVLSTPLLVAFLDRLTRPSRHGDRAPD